MLVVNYWNATIGVFGLDEAGTVGEAKSIHDPNKGRAMKVSHTKHVNHSENDPNAQKERQSDPLEAQRLLKSVEKKDKKDNKSMAEALACRDSGSVAALSLKRGV